MHNPPDEEARAGLPNQPSEESLTAAAAGPVTPSEPPRQPAPNPLIAWFSSVQHTATFLGVVPAGGFSGIFILINIGVMGREPMVQEVSPLSVTRLGEVVITGENLDLVSAVYLRVSPCISMMTHPLSVSKTRR